MRHARCHTIYDEFEIKMVLSQNAAHELYVLYFFTQLLNVGSPYTQCITEYQRQQLT